MADSRRALLLGENESLTLAALRALAAGGWSVELGSPRLLPTARFSRGCRRFHHLRHGWTARTTEVIDRVARGQPLAVVVPADLEAARWLAEFSGQLQAPSVAVPPLALSDVTMNKARFAAKLEAAGLPHPRTEVIDDRAALRKRPLTSPLMLKPAVGGNSEGVRRVSNTAELERYLEQDDRGGDLLLQEFIPGEDVDVSVLAEEGAVIAWTCQRLDPADDYARVLFDDPAARAVAFEVIRTLGYTGLAHLDLRRDERDGSVKVLELNPRCWMSVLYSMWAGVNFLDLAARRALGERPASPVMRPGTYRRPLFRPASIVRTIRHWSGDASHQPFWDTLGDPLPQLIKVVRNRLPS